MTVEARQMIILPQSQTITTAVLIAAVVQVILLQIMEVVVVMILVVLTIVEVVMILQAHLIGNGKEINLQRNKNS
jgi:hypothetical protein